MGRTVSGRELKAGQEEYAMQYSQVLLAKLAEGKRVPKSNDKISVKESLISKTTSKERIIENCNTFAPEFKKYSGKKAPTGKIFDKCIGRTAKNENVISA